MPSKEHLKLGSLERGKLVLCGMKNKGEEETYFHCVLLSNVASIGSLRGKDGWSSFSLLSFTCRQINNTSTRNVSSVC